jgi:hypothetical protein
LRAGRIDAERFVDPYVFTVARNVLREWQKNRPTDPIDTLRVHPPDHKRSIEVEVIDASQLVHYLAALSEDDRNLLIRYYAAPEERDQICSERGITPADLRSHVFKIKEKIRLRFPQASKGAVSDSQM